MLLKGLKQLMLSGSCFVLTAFAEEPLPDLEVRVSGAEAQSGQLLLSLFDSEESYLKEPLLERRIPVNGEGEGIFLIESLETGVYAVSVIYDEDSDGELDTGLFGIPKEKIGMSNNAKSSFGPPSFEKTRFELNSSISIDIFLDDVSD